MRDVIQKMIATEAEAARIVAAARSEADRVLSAAQEEAAKLLEQARQEARLEAEQVLGTAVEAAEEERRKQLATIRATIDTQLHLPEPDRQRAINAALRCICGQNAVARE